MRIALFHNLPSGGAKRAIFEWVRRLSTEHTIDVFSLSSADHAFCDIRPYVSNYQVYPFSSRGLFRSPLGRLNQFQQWRDLRDLEQLNRQIAKQINLGGYDVLFANTCKYSFIPALIQDVKIPSVYYLHEPFGPGFIRRFDRPYSSKNNWREKMDRFDPLIGLYERRLETIQTRCIHRTTRLLANSQFTAECICAEFGTKPEFCPYGVDMDGFYVLDDVQREEYAVSVGEMSPRKGFDFIVESLGKIPAGQRLPLKLACNMVNENELAYVKALAEHAGVKLEVLVGLGVPELRSLYNRARLCLYTPVMEPFGLVPLEAMACGTPVIGVREGGVMESIIHEQTGLLIERDKEQFAAAIQSLSNNPVLLESYGRNAREHVVRNWSWDRSVSSLNSHLQAVCLN